MLQNQYIEEHLKKTRREHILFYSKMDNQTSLFSFMCGDNFHSHSSLSHTAAQYPNVNRRKTVTKREKLNIVSPCLNSKRVGTNPKDLINVSNKIIWDFMAYWSRKYAWEVPIHHLWGQRTPRENTAPAANHSHPSEFKSPVARPARKNLSQV